MSRKKHIFKLLLVGLILLGIHDVNAQRITPFKSWNQNQLAKANTAKSAEGLSFQEKKVIFYINLVRMNGALFVDTYLKDYLEDVRVPKNKYYRSLVKTLKGLDPLPPLEPQEDISKECVKHAKEMGKKGKKGHRSGTGKSYSERMEKYKKRYKKVKELNQYGDPDALSIVIDLLIDDGMESLVHRRAILSDDFNYIGVAIRAHKVYRVNTCLIFGGPLLTLD